jgi:O-antigen/teichoic acid export membrane protein
MTLQTQSLDGGAGAPSAPRRWRLGGLFSLNYFLLRSFTAGGAVVNGLVQTFVFARVLTPKEFSIYILIFSFGVALWLFDLGGAKILFVRQRERHLSEAIEHSAPAQSNAIILLYALVVLAGAVLCFGVAASRPSVTLLQAFQYAAFFSFSGLNLVWFPIRNVSGAVDEFITFEVLEVVRRVGHIALMLALLVGLPFVAFLLLGNLVWALVFVASIVHLVRRGALAPTLRGCWRALRTFWAENHREIVRSANYSVGELVIYNYPYFIVPLAFGLGAPVIILDTTFKIFRGATLIYAAGLDPLVPRQTRAFAENDMATLRKATWTATILCAIPTAVLCALLLFGGEKFFALLLGHAVTMPPATTPILVVLLVGNLVHSVASSLLLHTGFFREAARAATFALVGMAMMTGLVVIFRIGIVGFISWYAAVYVAGAMLYAAYAMRVLLLRPSHPARSSA